MASNRLTLPVLALAMLPAAPAAAQGISGACTAIIQRLCHDTSNAPDFIARCYKRYPDVLGLVPEKCVADFQSAVEGANDAAAAEEEAAKTRPSRRQRVGTLPVDGQSYGGVLRDRPDVNARQVGSLQEGDAITILEDTGYSYQDYTWYKIRVRGRVAYHWGGIICSYDSRLDGVYKQCPD